MVSIIENWAIIIGMVIGIAPAEPGQKFGELIIEIERIEAVENYPMLLQQKPGEKIQVRVRPEQLGMLSDHLNSKVSIRVRRGQNPQVVFAAADWKFMKNDTQ